MYTEAIKSHGINKAVRQVQEFHSAFGHPVGETPTPMDVLTASKRMNYDVEEIVEFLHATARGEQNLFCELVDTLIEGVLDAQEKLLAENKTYATDEDVLVAQSDALIDKEYFNKGHFVVMGIEQPQKMLDIVHHANMGKLDENGKPILHPETNKVMKPDGWEEKYAPEPRLRKVLVAGAVT